MSLCVRWMKDREKQLHTQSVLVLIQSSSAAQLHSCTVLSCSTLYIRLFGQSKVTVALCVWVSVSYRDSSCFLSVFTTFRPFRLPTDWDTRTKHTPNEYRYKFIRFYFSPFSRFSWIVVRGVRKTGTRYRQTQCVYLSFCAFMVLLLAAAAWCCSLLFISFVQSSFWGNVV